MGDATWLEMTIVPDDRKTVEAELGTSETEDSNPDGTIFLHYDEVNYGGYKEFQNLAEKKVDFLALHGEGGTYGGMSYVCLDGKLFKAYIDHEEDMYAKIRRDEDGKIIVSDAHIKNAEEFYAAKDTLAKKWADLAKDENKTLVIEGVDLELLEVQRKTLSELVCDVDDIEVIQGDTLLLNSDQIDALLGIVHMLDHWSDEREKEGMRA